MKIPEVNFLPSNECVFCGKTIEEIGGRRISLQRTKGVSVFRTSQRS